MGVLSQALEALTKRPRLLRSYLIGIDKTVHMGLGLEEIGSVAILIDRYVGDIAAAALAEIPVVLCGDHPVLDGRLKRTQGKSMLLWFFPIYSVRRRRNPD